MKIEHGLMDGQVLQRDSDGRGGAEVSGTCLADGSVDFRVLQNRRIVRGLDWQQAGLAKGRRFSASIHGLRTGGPYSVELRIRIGRQTRETSAAENVYVGDVWILAGQSNMEGVGNLEHAPRPNPKVRAFYMRDEWGAAEEPMHMLSEAVDPVHNGYGAGKGRPSRKALAKARARQVKGMSPGHVFGLEMLKRTKAPQGLIACAHGGTSMAEWSPDLREKGGQSLYGAMMRRYGKLGQPVAGILWYQGESDANPDAARVYTDKMKALVAATRRDMRLPRLPWLVVQLGCHAAIESDIPWNSIQEQQRRLPEFIENLDVAPAIDLELDDGIHIGGRGQRTLGQRLARIADSLVHGRSGAKPAIRIKSMEIVPAPGAGADGVSSALKITYENVAGRLISVGRPSGFTLTDSKGNDLRGVYKTVLKGNSAIVCTNLSGDMLSMMSVSYGYGRFPYCNITDEEGMGLPGFQAMQLDPFFAPWCDGWEVARFKQNIPLGRITASRVMAMRGWGKAPRRQGFGYLPKDPQSNATGSYAFRKVINASEPMKARLFFGANAPFRLWVNGSKVLEDPNCTMPINNPRYVSDIQLRQGKNLVLVGFVTGNPGAHIGIYARVGNRDGKRDERIRC